MWCTRVTEILGIEYPIIGGPMQWLSRSKFVSAISNGGGLGIITSASFSSKDQGESELVLTAYYTSGPTGFSTAEEAVDMIRASVEWDLKVSDKLEAMEAPTKEELYILRLFDPFKQFLR